MPVAEVYLDPATLKRLSTLKTWRTALAIAFDWGVIALCVAASQAAHNIVVYLVAVAIIGGRMHGFGVLLHDFAHYRFIDKRKALSDWVCELTLSWPILTTVAAYRSNHLAHHRYTNTDKDPDWMFKLGNHKFTFPQSWQHGVLTLASYLLVIGSVLDVFSVAKRLSGAEKPPLSYRLTRLGYYLALAILFTLTGSWMLFVLYWLVPYLTTFFLLMHIRSVAEHFGSMDYSHELGSTRSVLPFYWERAFFAPHNVNYHLEHHLYPSVPFYNLPQLHQALMANPAYVSRAHNTRGYTTGLVRETLTRAQPRPNSA
ncbi:fatty acid desaturase family protein [Devosia sp.]|uniref:fatty acid desaturase family protein n=1 Tax=Devosia sp. TaxID=1871048 RepID=UPI003262DD64